MGIGLLPKFLAVESSPADLNVACLAHNAAQRISFIFVIMTQGHFLEAHVTRAGHCWLILVSPIQKIQNFGKESWEFRPHCALVTPVPLLFLGALFDGATPGPLRGCLTISVFETALWASTRTLVQS